MKYEAWYKYIKYLKKKILNKNLVSDNISYFWKGFIVKA